MIPNIGGTGNIITSFAIHSEMQAAIEYWKEQQRKEGVPERDIHIVEEAIQDSLNGEDMDQFGGRYFVVNIQRNRDCNGQSGNQSQHKPNKHIPVLLLDAV